MKPILILLPSKGRPDKIEGFYKEWRETTEGCSQIITCLDDDDPTINKYKAHKDVSFDIGAGKSMCGTLNRVFYKNPNYKYYYVVSDDHRIKTKYWESRFIEKIKENGDKGVCYGNDLMYGETLPTAQFVSGNIVRALGYIALPGLYHMWIDKFWLEIGKGLKKLFYFPDIFVEHMHFTVGKSQKDYFYQRVNNKRVYEHDKQVFDKWEKDRKAKDILACFSPSF